MIYFSIMIVFVSSFSMNHSTSVPAGDKVDGSLAALSVDYLAAEKVDFDNFSLIRFGLNCREVV